jgi:hypothetical protein
VRLEHADDSNAGMHVRPLDLVVLVPGHRRLGLGHGERRDRMQLDRLVPIELAVD